MRKSTDKPEQDEVLDFIKKFPNGVSAREVVKHFENKDFSKSSIQLTLQRMIDTRQTIHLGRNFLLYPLN